MEKIHTTILALFLIFVFLSPIYTEFVSINTAFAIPIETKTKFATVLDYGDGSGMASISIAPNAYNGTNWVEYEYTDYGTYHQVQTGMIGARLYNYYTVYYDSNMTEVRLYDERFEIQKWESQGQGSWGDLGVQGDAPNWEVVTNSSGAFITKTFSSWAGVLSIEYCFWVGSPLKHNIVWTSDIVGSEEFGIVQKLAGIVGDRVRHDGGITTISGLNEINSTIFEFLKPDGSLSLGENQRATGVEVNGTYYNYVLQPSEIDTHANGMKADFYFRNSTLYTLSQGESILLDPATYSQSQYNLFSLYNSLKYGGDSVTYVGNYQWSERRGVIGWDISSISDSATVTSAYFKYDSDRADDENEMRQCDSEIVASSYATLWAECTSGAIYYSGAMGIGTNLQIEFSSTIYSEIEDDLTDDDKFCVGLRNPNPNGEYDFWTLDTSSPVPNPTLEVTYTTNTAPTNDSCSSNATFTIDIYEWVNITVSDVDLVADLKEVRMQINTTSDSETFTGNWTQSSNSFSEVSDSSGVFTLDTGTSTRINIDTDTDKICFYFKITTGATVGDCDIKATTTDDADANDIDLYSNDFELIASANNAPTIPHLKLVALGDSSNLTAINPDSFYEFQVNVSEIDTMANIVNLTIRVEKAPSVAIGSDSFGFTEASKYWFRYDNGTDAWEWYNGTSSAWDSDSDEAYLNSSLCDNPTLGSNMGYFNFTLRLSKIASKGTDWDFDAIVFDSGGENATKKFDAFDVNAYIEYTLNTSTVSWSTNVGDNNSSATAPINVTVTCNTGVKIQIKGDTDLLNGSHSIPISNVVVDDDADAGTDANCMKLSTSYTDWVTGISAGADQKYTMYWFLTTPNPQFPGAYTTTFYVQAVE